MKKINLVYIGFFLFILTHCRSGEINLLPVPEHFPRPDFPDDNIPTAARIALGKSMFFDRALSLDSTVSCSSCHIPEKVFTDGLAISPGIMGRSGRRNTPSLFNAAYLHSVNRDGGVVKLDLQAVVPIEDENEMGISLLELSKRLNRDPEYVRMAHKAYKREIDPFVITRALGTFVRTLYSGNSLYDQFLQGDTAALTSSANRGLKLFESARLGCSSCHSGFLLTNLNFENNGLYDFYSDKGRALITLDSLDTGKFRVASLRNVALTSPYMFDGSLATLEEVLDHYEKAGKYPKSTQSKLLRHFELTEEERLDLIAFLKSLTEL